MTQYEYNAIAFADDKPTFLDAGAMREKLASLGLHPESTLGRHALSGGPLYARDGHYRLATTENLANANRPSARSVGQCCGCLELMKADDEIVRNAYGVALHRECEGLSYPEARRRRNGEAPRAATTEQPSATNETRSLLDRCADIYAGSSVSSVAADEGADPPLLVAAADLYCGPRRTEAQTLATRTK